MNLNITVLILTFLLTNFLISQNYILIFLTLLTTFIYFLISKFMINRKKKEVRDYISLILKNESAKKSQIINLNNEKWQIFEELPFFNRVSAKRAVWLKYKYGKYQSVNDFAEKNNLKEEDKKLLSLIAFV